MAVADTRNLADSEPISNFTSFDFANPYPYNTQAKLAFDEVANEIKAGRFQEASRFIHVGHKSLLEDPQVESQVLHNVSETETGTEEEGCARDPLEIWTGHYRLSLGQQLALPAAGWRVGGGRWGKFDGVDGGVELLLAKKKQPRSRLFGHHARFAFDQHGSLNVIVNHVKKPSVTLGDHEFREGQRVISKRNIRILFGDLAYMFRFCHVSR
jgi:hypothetical protein